MSNKNYERDIPVLAYIVDTISENSISFCDKKFIDKLKLLDESLYTNSYKRANLVLHELSMRINSEIDPQTRKDIKEPFSYLRNIVVAMEGPTDLRVNNGYKTLESIIKLEKAISMPKRNTSIHSQAVVSSYM